MSAGPVITRYGYTWIQHPDGLYYGPRVDTDDDMLLFLEADGTLGHSSVRRGETRYFLRHPEADEDRDDRFTWTEDNEGTLEDPEEAADA